MYVDEATGDDQTGDGSQGKPFKTVVGAFISRASDTVNVYVRQAAAEGEAQGSYAAATASAKKKATKLLQQHRNKLAKDEERRKREEVEGEARRAAELKKLEEAKAIIIDEPKEDSTKIKIRQAVEQRGKRVRVFGWVHRLRQQGGMTFVVLRDGTGYLQCVLSGRLVRPPLSLSLHLPTSRSSSQADLSAHPLPPAVANLRRPHPHARVDGPDHGRHQPAPRGQDGARRPRAHRRLVRGRRQGSRRRRGLPQQGQRGAFTSPSCRLVDEAMS